MRPLGLSWALVFPGGRGAALRAAHIFADFALELQIEIKLEADGGSRGPLQAVRSLGRGKDEPVIRVSYLPGWCLTHSEPRAFLREDKLGLEVDAYCTHSPTALCSNLKLPWGCD